MREDRPTAEALAEPKLSASSVVAGNSKKTLRFGIIIPAHQEEENLKRTLPTLMASIRRAEALTRYLAKVELVVSVHVVADGCTDRTEEVARRLGANVHRTSRPNGKWAALNGCVRLIEKATAYEPFDWFGFVDAGVQWDENFFSRIVSEILSHPTAQGVAPTYRAPGSGLLQSFVWAFERHFKNLEAAVGGPVSVHGATVFYRRWELVTALNFLSRRPKPGIAWLNDDVALPMTLRSLFPSNPILYLADAGVSDPQEKPGREYNRRRRMAIGNLQWIKGILPQAIRSNPVAALLALRRVARMLWAFWFIALTAGFGGMVLGSESLILAPLLACIAFLACLAPAEEASLDAARASISVPFYLISSDGLEAQAKTSSKGSAWR